MNNNVNEFDGVIEYDALMGMSPMKNNPFDNDNFYEMDGRGCRCGCCPKCEQKSNAVGGLLPSRGERQRNRARRQARRDSRLDARATRKQTRADARGTRASAKLTQADSSRVAAQNLGQESQSDIELAKALASTQPIGETKKGLSKNAKIGIAVGSVVVLGVIGFFVYKSVTKKK